MEGWPNLPDLSLPKMTGTVIIEASLGEVSTVYILKKFNESFQDNWPHKWKAKIDLAKNMICCS